MMQRKSAAWRRHVHEMAQATAEAHRAVGLPITSEVADMVFETVKQMVRSGRDFDPMAACREVQKRLAN